MTRPNLKDVVLTIALRQGYNGHATLGELAKISGLSVREVADRLRETGVCRDLRVNPGQKFIQTKSKRPAKI